MHLHSQFPHLYVVMCPHYVLGGINAQLNGKNVPPSRHFSYTLKDSETMHTTFTKEELPHSHLSLYIIIIFWKVEEYMYTMIVSQPSKPITKSYCSPKHSAHNRNIDVFS